MTIAKACQGGDRDAVHAALDGVEIAGWTRDVLTTFLVDHGHLVHDWDEEPVEAWVRAHLAEADPLNLLEGRPVPPARRARPHNTPAQERFLRACQASDVATIEAMLAGDPTLITTRTKWGMTCTYNVGAYGSHAAENAAALRVLLAAGDARPFEALTGAAWWGSEDVVRELLAGGVSPEDRRRGESALHACCVASRFNEFLEPDALLGIANTLLDAGADPDYPDLRGWTPFGMSVGSLRTCLVDRGAAPVGERPGLDGFWSGDRLALAGDDPGLLRFRNGATDATAIMEAAFAGQRDLARALAELKGALDLDEAAAIGDADAVARELDELLWLPGPRWLATPRLGRPLHLAAHFGHAHLVDRLLDAGYSVADDNAADIAGHWVGPVEVRDTTPLALAERRGHRELVARFRAVVEAHHAEA